MSVVPGVPLWELGEIETLTPLERLVTVSEPVPVGEVGMDPVAVTVMVSIVPPVLFGMFTVTVTVVLAPDPRTTEVADRVGPQFSVSPTLRVKLSDTRSLFVMVTVSVTPLVPSYALTFGELMVGANKTRMLVTFSEPTKLSFQGASNDCAWTVTTSTRPPLPKGGLNVTVTTVFSPGFSLPVKVLDRTGFQPWLSFTLRV